jgi:hypothetical protein
VYVRRVDSSDLVFESFITLILIYVLSLALAFLIHNKIKLKKSIIQRKFTGNQREPIIGTEKDFIVDRV